MTIPSRRPNQHLFCKQICENENEEYTCGSVQECGNRSIERFSKRGVFSPQVPIVLQSGEVNDIDYVSSTPNEHEEETVKFHDQKEGSVLTFEKCEAKIFDGDRIKSAELGTFLHRPVMIYSNTIPAGAFSTETLDPWSLFLNTPGILYKLHNHYLLRGNLHIKVVVNATPFVFGRFRLSYTPLPEWRPALAGDTRVPVSQRPGVYIDLSENKGGEMVLPFFYPKNYVNLTSAADVATLGQLQITEFATISTVGSVAASATIAIYAWMQDEVLTVPTVGLALQSGDQDDEYAQGPLTRLATSVSKWSGYFTTIPIIGPFALATTIGSTAVSQIASIFGWSVVPVITDVQPVKNLLYHDMSNSGISQPSTKFTLDPKGEMSVDPRIVGLDGTDELTIKNIVTKDSFVGSSTWGSTEAVGTLLLSAQVSPMNSAQLTAADMITINPTPMAYVSELFNYWRGDIIYNFKVVCTKFHSGRLRVTWDPFVTLTSTTDYTHIAKTEIFDLSEDTNFEFRVPYAQPVNFLKTRSFEDSAKGVYDHEYVAAHTTSNGTLTVRVLTLLKSPIASTVAILVHVRGSENIEFSDPRPINNTLNLITMQSSDINDSFAPQELGLINFGERIISLRPLLRRSTLHSIIAPTSGAVSTAVVDVYSLHKRKPAPRGYLTTAYTEAHSALTPYTDHKKFSYNATTPIAWVSAAFVGIRGAMRWQYAFTNASAADGISNMYVQRSHRILSANSASLNCTSSGAQSVSPNAIASHLTHYSTGAEGLLVTNIRVQPGISVEVPMINSYKFENANPNVWLTDSTLDNTEAECVEVGFNTGIAISTAECYARMRRYVGTGTDFNLYFFINAPVVFRSATSGTVIV